MTKLVYLDYAATTPVDPKVMEVMQQYLSLDGDYANASNVVHAMGRDAMTAVEVARDQVADLINAQAEEMIFTSSATESINMAIKGVAEFYHRKGKHIITLKTEHKAVTKVCEALQKQGFDITYLDVQPSGLLDLDALRDAIREDTVLVSILHVNNEFGVIQDLPEIARIVKEKNSFLHVDGVQSVGKLNVDMAEIPVDFMSLSGHKLYAPKGIGALYVRKGLHLKPIMQGAGQERGLRPGTLPVHQIAAMGEAYRLAKQVREKDMSHYKMLGELFFQSIQSVGGIRINGDRANCIPNIINLSFENVDPLKLIEAVSEKLAISTGAACATKSMEPSKVLLALGVSAPMAQAAIRFSFGRFTTEEDIKVATDVIYDISSRGLS